MIPSSRTADRRRQTFSSPLLSTKGTGDRGVLAAAVHPGGIQTELARHVGRDQDPEILVEQINQQRAAQGEGPFEWKTIPQGAATSVWAAVVAPSRGDRRPILRELPRRETRSGQPDDQWRQRRSARIYTRFKNAEALWKKSEQMVGESF